MQAGVQPNLKMALSSKTVREPFLSICDLLIQVPTTASPTTCHSLRVKQHCVYVCIFITAYMYVMRLKRLNVFTLVHRMEGGAWT